MMGTIKVNQNLINEILDLRQKLAVLEAQAGMSKRDKPRGFAKLEPVDKKPASKDGPYYQCIHTVYDPHNAITLLAETVIQTKCEKWVKRMGGILSEPLNRLPPKYEPANVLVLTGTIEDKEEEGAVKEETDDEPRRFQRKGRGE